MGRTKLVATSPTWRNTSIRFAASAATLAAGALLALPALAPGAILIPNTTLDENTPTGTNCSLREAIIAANTDGDHNDCVALDEGHDSILLSSGLEYVRSLTPDTDEDANADGDLDVEDPGGGQIESLSIFGNGAQISGTGIASGGRVFHVTTGDLTLIDVEVESGRAATSGGGGILNLGELRLVRSTVTLNTSEDNGGGVENAGTLDVVNSTIEGNFAQESGGGLDNFIGTATLNNATVANNQANTDAAMPDGVAGGVREFGGTVNLQNTIVAGNFQAFLPFPGPVPDCSGGPTSLGYNLIGNTGGCGWVSNTGDVTNPATPGLSLLADNGGDTRTIALLPSSPAREAGSPSTPGTFGDSCEFDDQRMVARPLGLRCDIGAFEATPVTTTIPAGTVPAAPPATTPAQRKQCKKKKKKRSAAATRKKCKKKRKR